MIWQDEVWNIIGGIIKKKMKTNQLFPFWRITGDVARNILAQFSYNANQCPLDNTTILMFPGFTIRQIGYYLFNLPLQFVPSLDHHNGCVMKMFIFLCWNGRYSFKLTEVVLYPWFG